MDSRATRCGIVKDSTDDLNASSAPPPSHVSLTSNEVAVLDLERQRWEYPGVKEAAVYDRFGWTMTRYCQVLNTLIDTPAALAADPVTINRLRHLREQRQQQRTDRGSA